MPPRTAGPPLTALSLDPAGPVPLYRQLYFALREAILAGRLRAGTRLPASRVLAADLGLSRNTVTAAFEQLLAEGYIEARVGAGSFVSRTLPEELLTARGVQQDEGSRTGGRAALSARGSTLLDMRPDGPPQPRPFALGVPELAAFPFEVWARLLSRRWRAPPRQLLVAADPAGYRPLREAIASYLGGARAASCTADQILVVAGAKQALDLAARVLLDPGDAVWVEEPGYAGTRGVLKALGARLVPVPVDGEGLDVAAGAAAAPDARLVCIAPSHQFPSGATMSLARRLALLDWAQTSGAMILEDDFDSEYRYAGRPLAALQGLDRNGRVIYVGTLSRVMFPALRLAYMVVPGDLIDAFLRVRALLDTHPSTVAQAALADFIAEGHLAAHVRRMRALYAERQAALVSALRDRLVDRLSVAPDEAGMHLVAGLPDDEDDVDLTRRASAHGVETQALSAFYLGRPTRRALLLGYAGVPVPEIDRAVDRLASAFGTA
ncbi:MAG: PLP-dependent aminotransferase family protein [Alphaproteobacteria bacterium]|nr:PLP-dependent aminotransferase family protein [Alphaproteobacteria bacterium]